MNKRKRIYPEYVKSPLLLSKQATQAYFKKMQERNRRRQINDDLFKDYKIIFRHRSPAPDKNKKGEYFNQFQSLVHYFGQGILDYLNNKLEWNDIAKFKKLYNVFDRYKALNPRSTITEYIFDISVSYIGKRLSILYFALDWLEKDTDYEKKWEGVDHFVEGLNEIEGVKQDRNTLETLLDLLTVRKGFIYRHFKVAFNWEKQQVIHHAYIADKKLDFIIWSKNILFEIRKAAKACIIEEIKTVKAIRNQMIVTKTVPLFSPHSPLSNLRNYPDISVLSAVSKDDVHQFMRKEIIQKMEDRNYQRRLYIDRSPLVWNRPDVKTLHVLDFVIPES